MQLARRISMSLAILALLGIAVTPAMAGKPDRAFAPAEPEFTLTGFCAFDVLVELVANKEYTTTFYDRWGDPTRTHIAGRFVVRLTNVDTSKAIVLNASGPGNFIFDADGLTVQGTGSWFLFFSGQLLAVNGNLVLRVDDAGETIVRIRGHTVELCSVLAS